MRGELPKLTDVNIDDYLTEQDYDKKKAGIISRIVNKPITIDYRKGINCAFLKQDSSFHITKSLPKIKGIDGNTAMNHELAHILFESFDPRAIRTVNEWALKWNNSEQKESDLAKKIYYEALNVIEDQRIESLWGKIYLGNFKDFIRVRKKLGKDLEFVESPTFSLLAERFFREDLLPNSKYGFVGKLIHDVEGKDVMASILVLNKIKPYLDETIKNALKLKEEFLFESSNVRSMKGETHRATYEEIKKAEEKRDKVHSDFQKATCQSNVARKIDDKNRIESLHQIDIVSAEPYEKEELANYEKKLEELKQSADEKLNSIKIAMEGGDVPINKVEVRVKPIKKNSAPIEPKINAGVVKEMKRLLRMFKEKSKDIMVDDGYELDVGEYINMKANGFGQCFIDDAKSNGLSIVVSIDGSGSMRLHNPMVKQLVSTLWKSIEGHNTIELKCITWSSDASGNMNIQKFQNIDELKYLDQQVGGYTPTHFGIEMGSHILKEMSGQRKLLIVITDGYPNYIRRGVRLKMDTVLKEVIKAYKRALLNTPNISIIGVGETLYHDSSMRGLFGAKKYIVCKTMEDVSQFMINTLRKEIIHVMKQ